MRVEKAQQEKPELDGLDEYDLAALNGEGYDASDPSQWPDELKSAARANWKGGPEAFDKWVASQPK